MTPEEKSAFKAELAAEFVFMRRDTFYNALARAALALVAGLGVTFTAIYTYLNSRPVEIAQRHILSLENEAEQHVAALKIGTYVRIDQPYFLQSTLSKNDLHIAGAETLARGNIVQDARESKQSWRIQLAPTVKP